MKNIKLKTQWENTKEPFYHKIIFPILIKLIQKYNSGKIIDIGCGNGALTQKIQSHGFDISGCDSDENGIEIAKTFSNKFYNIGVYDNPESLGLNSFDMALSTEVIEHLYSPDSFFDFASKLLKPSGILILSTPYHGYFKNLALSIFNAWDYHLNPLIEGGHIKFFSKKTLSEILKRNNYEIIEWAGAGRIAYLWNSILVVARKKVINEY